MDTKNKTLSKQEQTMRLTVSAILIALGTVLSMIKVYSMPFGGSVTLCSMLPLLLIGGMYGVKWGLLSGMVYGVLQAILGATMSQAFAGQNAPSVILICLFDYLLAYTVIGLSGMFLRGEKGKVGKLVAGSFVAMCLRYVCHFVSGAIFYGEWAEWYFSQEGFYSWGQKILEKFSGVDLSVVYSAIYNLFYLLPEIIITMVVAVIIFSVKPLQKYIFGAALSKKTEK